MTLITIAFEVAVGLPQELPVTEIEQLKLFPLLIELVVNVFEEPD
jgi:hypothetical protein